MAMAIMDRGFGSKIHMVSGIKNPSSTHSALSRLLKDETIGRGKTSDGRAGYRYFFNHKISVQDCFAEFKRRVESRIIEFDSLSNSVNEYLTGEDNKIELQLFQKELKLENSSKAQLKTFIRAICNFFEAQDEVFVIELKLQDARKQIEAYEQVLGKEFMDFLVNYLAYYS